MSYLFEKGKLNIGCNYWASHAGTNMWSDWNEKVVEDDLKKLSSNNIGLLRVFPLWSDFQPITKLLGGNAQVREISHGEKFLDPSTEEGRAGVDPVMIERFARFCRIADKYGIKLIVSILNGWMSGRDFVPPALVGHNLYTDPFAVTWEIRFIRYFVKRFCGECGIIIWEPGNECNCLEKSDSHDAAWLWTAAVTDAIRCSDPTRPVSSGMHGLYSGAFDIAGQAENCDYLTVHPYVTFTPYCAEDGIVSPRAIMHSSAEQTFYSDMGGKPCFVEEIGSLCNMMGSEETTADFVRASLFDAWAHGGLAYLWWCAFDQNLLTHAPYEWCDVERELGFFRADGSPKPIVKEVNDFASFLRSFPIKNLPDRKREAVCFLRPQDLQGMFGSYFLAKRAGFDVKFADIGGKAPESALYVIPGNCSFEFLKKSVYDMIIENVRNGAVLLITLNNGVIGGFEELVGCKSKGRFAGKRFVTTFGGKKITLCGDNFLRLVPSDAEVLASDDEGAPVFTKHKVGKGCVFFLNAALERRVATTPGVLLGDEDAGEVFYKYVAECAGIERAVKKNTPTLVVNEYDLGDGKTLIVALNDTEAHVSEKTPLEGYTLSAVYRGTCVAENGTISYEVPPADATVFELKKVETP